MILKRISILNYKNLEQVELNFSAKLNCFFGQNGMGKTNLLDAVYFLSFCKSAGNPIDSQNIRHEQDFFVIQARPLNGGLPSNSSGMDPIQWDDISSSYPIR